MKIEYLNGFKTLRFGNYIVKTINFTMMVN